jgi:CheY-like chemotaxis protein
VFQSAGYQIVEAFTGQDALRLTREYMPDLVLLDAVLPDINGIEVCRQIKSDPSLGDVFLVLASRLSVAASDHAQGLESGSDGYIALPIPNRELVARVATLIRLRNAEVSSRASARQMSVLAELGRRVFAREDVSALMEATVTEIVEALGVEYGEIVEHVPGDGTFVLRAGTGSLREQIGDAVDANACVEFTSALSGEVVILETHSAEEDSALHPLLRGQRIAGGISLCIPGRDRPFGVMSVHCTVHRSFSQDDVHFLQSVAYMVATAV